MRLSLAALLASVALSTAMKITHRAKTSKTDESKFETISFDDLYPEQSLLPFTKPYHNLLFSEAFSVVNSSDNLIPAALAPLSAPNLAIAIDSGDDTPPSIRSVRTLPLHFFSIRSLGVAPVIDEGRVAFALCLTGFNGPNVINGLCQKLGEGEGLRKVVVEGLERVDKVEISVVYDKERVDFVIDDLVVEWIPGEDGDVKEPGEGDGDDDGDDDDDDDDDGDDDDNDGDGDGDDEGEAKGLRKLRKRGALVG